MESTFVGTLIHDLIIATVVHGAQPYGITSRLRVVVAWNQRNISPREAVRKGVGHFNIGGAAQHKVTITTCLFVLAKFVA